MRSPFHESEGRRQRRVDVRTDAWSILPTFKLEVGIASIDEGAGPNKMNQLVVSLETFPPKGS